MTNDEILAIILISLVGVLLIAICLVSIMITLKEEEEEEEEREARLYARPRAKQIARANNKWAEVCPLMAQRLIEIETEFEIFRIHSCFRDRISVVKSAEYYTIECVPPADDRVENIMVAQTVMHLRDLACEYSIIMEHRAAWRELYIENPQYLVKGD